MSANNDDRMPEKRRLLFELNDFEQIDKNELSVKYLWGNLLALLDANNNNNNNSLHYDCNNKYNKKYS